MNQITARPHSGSHLTNQDLVSNLLEIAHGDIKGETVPEIIEYLINHSDKSDRVMMVKEIALRYGEKRLSLDEPFNRSSQVYEHFRMRLGEAKQEHFFVILLDNKNRIIKEQLVSLGTVNKSLVHSREVFAPAIEHRAAAVVLVHNHPAGQPEPSSQDREITKRLCEVGELVGIKVLDHVIVCRDSYYSFIDNDEMS
jgi:DNA repair protein RadC